MSQPAVDEIHYIRIPNALGGRAEMVRMCYALAGKPYVDILPTIEQARAAVAGKNPFKQFPFVVTPSGEVVYQTLAIMHHAAHGTPAWPSDPAALTRALSVAMGAYDLFQAFAGFSANDLAAKKKFEEKTAPQLFSALGEIYATRPFAAGEAPCFADCIVQQAVGWCVRRNEVCRGLLEANPSLSAFLRRFEDSPVIRAFIERQAAARALDDSV